MKPERIQHRQQAETPSSLTDLLERFPEWVVGEDGHFIARQWHAPTRRSAAALVVWICELADAVGSDPEIILQLNVVETKLGLTDSELDASLALASAVEGGV